MEVSTLPLPPTLRSAVLTAGYRTVGALAHAEPDQLANGVMGVFERVPCVSMSSPTHPGLGSTARTAWHGWNGGQGLLAATPLLRTHDRTMQTPPPHTSRPWPRPRACAHARASSCTCPCRPLPLLHTPFSHHPNSHTHTHTHSTGHGCPDSGAGAGSCTVPRGRGPRAGGRAVSPGAAGPRAVHRPGDHLLRRARRSAWGRRAVGPGDRVVRRARRRQNAALVSTPIVGKDGGSFGGGGL